VGEIRGGPAGRKKKKEKGGWLPIEEKLPRHLTEMGGSHPHVYRKRKKKGGSRVIKKTKGEKSHHRHP